MGSPVRYPFLTTAPAQSEDGFRPLLRSSLAHRHRALGARLEERDGWVVAASYPAEGALPKAVVADVSHVGKLEVYAPSEPNDDAVCASVAVGPGHWVVLCRYRDLPGLLERLGTAAEHVVDRTSAWCALLLAGEARDTLLRRVSNVRDLPGRGPLGKVPATILDRPNGYWLLCSQEYAQYAWDLVVDAATPLGGGPAGVDAVAAHDPLLAVAPAVGVSA